MNLKNLIENRYSVRNYLTIEIEKEKIEYILECARLAPSACNNQPWYFYVITDKELKEKIELSYPREWVKQAPVLIVVCKDTLQSWKRPKDGRDSGDIDASIAAEHICLAAESIGLGTCWICNFDQQILNNALQCPDHREPIAIFPIGYIDKANSKIPEKKRKSLDEVTSWK